jgi:hypothetical protein
MARKIKLQQLSDNVNPSKLILLDLCITLKHAALIQKINILELSMSASLSYPSTVTLLNGKNLNPEFKTLSSLAEQLGFDLRFNLVKKKVHKGEKNNDVDCVK